MDDLGQKTRSPFIYKYLLKTLLCVKFKCTVTMYKMKAAEKSKIGFHQNKNYNQILKNPDMKYTKRHTAHSYVAGSKERWGGLTYGDSPNTQEKTIMCLLVV